MVELRPGLSRQSIRALFPAATEKRQTEIKTAAQATASPPLISHNLLILTQFSPYVGCSAPVTSASDDAGGTPRWGETFSS